MLEPKTYMIVGACFVWLFGCRETPETEKTYDVGVPYTDAEMQPPDVATAHGSEAGHDGSKPDAVAPGSCVAGEKESCRTNFPGSCEEGSRKCLAHAEWGPCLPLVMPGTKAETLDQPTCSNQLDDDCDGLVDAEDEDCSPCSAGQTAVCATGLFGQCLKGTKSCDDKQNKWLACVGSVQPGEQPEDCGNGVDDDCDGYVDILDPDCVKCPPNSNEPCTSSSPGACREGTRTCKRQLEVWDWGECVPDLLPGSQPEDCDNKIDDDCDTTVDAQDEDCLACPPEATAPCATGLSGVCSDGIKTCGVDGTWSACVALVQIAEKPEVCGDELDNDCDGDTDADDSDCEYCVPGSTAACTSQLPGVCQAGQQLCQLIDGSWKLGECEALIAQGERQEACSDSLDNDCDGAADADDSDCAVCSVGEQLSCDTGQKGVCAAGNKTCSLQGSWGGCVPLVAQTNENCSDGLDNDCDGVVDFNDPDCLVCGDGVCEGIENSNNCPSDCCGLLTSCDQSWKDEGVYYCRSMNSIDNHVWIGTTAVDAYCSTNEDLCKAAYYCDGFTHYCKSIKSIDPAVWEVGSCTCGDGYCTNNGDTVTEDCASCPQDCEPCECGNGTCESTETGADCPEDCCDETTACDHHHDNGQGVQVYCRNMNDNGWAWISEAETISMCNEPSELCVSNAQCAGKLEENRVWCKSLTPPDRWVAGACECGDGKCARDIDGDLETCESCAGDCGQCVCGNGTCESTETGADCPEDCCDETTACDHHHDNGQGVEVYCRNMNDTGWAWYSEAQTKAMCDQTTELCVSNAQCAGKLGANRLWCKSISPTKWAQGTCSCGDGYCVDNGSTFDEHGDTCSTDCCDATTPCSFHKDNGSGTQVYCRNMNNSGWAWYSEAQTKAMCNQASELCVSNAQCAGKLGANRLWCKSISPVTWAQGTCSCGDGYCVDNGSTFDEHGDTCSTDCCDASTPCAFSKSGLYCRNMNDTDYDWYTETQTKAECNEASEICVSTARCDGKLHYCTGINPTSWGLSCP